MCSYLAAIYISLKKGGYMLFFKWYSCTIVAIIQMDLASSTVITGKPVSDITPIALQTMLVSFHLRGCASDLL